MLHFVALDAMYITWSFVFLVKVFEPPHRAQVLLPHQLVCILRRVLDAIQNLDVLEASSAKQIC